MKHSQAWIAATTRKRTNATNNDRNKRIKRLYEQRTRIQDIAKAEGITRMAVFKRLRNMGIDTSLRQRGTRTCPTCGKDVSVERGDMTKYRQSFCNIECYLAYLESLGDNYRESSYHCREARRIMSQHFTLSPGNIVHHEDHNNMNNSLSNLRVFENQSDHLKHHRGDRSVKAIWKG